MEKMPADATPARSGVSLHRPRAAAVRGVIHARDVAPPLDRSTRATSPHTARQVPLAANAALARERRRDPIGGNLLPRVAAVARREEQEAAVHRIAHRDAVLARPRTGSRRGRFPSASPTSAATRCAHRRSCDRSATSRRCSARAPRWATSPRWRADRARPRRGSCRASSARRRRSCAPRCRAARWPIRRAATPRSVRAARRRSGSPAQSTARDAASRERRARATRRARNVCSKTHDRDVRREDGRGVCVVL